MFRGPARMLPLRYLDNRQERSRFATLEIFNREAGKGAQNLGLCGVLINHGGAPQASGVDSVRIIISLIYLRYRGGSSGVQ